MQKFYFDRVAKDIVANYLWEIKVLNKHPLTNASINWVRELDSTHPRVFHEVYELSGPVMIRTYASGDLKRSNVT